MSERNDPAPPQTPSSKGGTHGPIANVMPERPIDRIVGPLERFLHVEAASGIVLLAAAAIALVLANSPLSESYLGIWKTHLRIGVGSFTMDHSLKHWINDGLMAVFFFVIGLEVKRELVLGELRDLRRATLPIAAAIGGMLVPAGLYLAMQVGGPAPQGWGIPMATDIAFVVGCLAVLGKRVPPGLRVMLLSLAIADDIGAILVIAIGYTDAIHVGALATGVAGLVLVNLLARLGVRSFGVYTILGALAWLAFHESGIHATIAGVILGLMTPAKRYLDGNVFARMLHRAGDVLHGDVLHGDAAHDVMHLKHAMRETVSPLEYLEARLHPWVSFAVMPLFALANAGVKLSPSDVASPVALAVIVGLVVGKPLGIFAASFAAVRLGLGRLPEGVTFRLLAAAGFLAGIGFTMALFISELAVDGESLAQAKVGVLAASALSAAIGMALLLTLLPKKSAGEPFAAR